MARPGIQPSLTREQIITQAFDMINEEGLDQFSMRGLSRRLNISPMALYTYFASKQDIIDGTTNRLRGKYDTSSVAGESWDDTLRRTASSIRKVNLAYSEVYQATPGKRSSDRQHMKRIHRLFRDQGMPLEVFYLLWACVEAYLTGFLNGEILQQTSNRLDVDPSDEDFEWLSMAATCYNDETFAQGIEFIIGGIKAKWPEESSWITPA